jgi:signal transduction histidine kinase/CheY-like chemotaxis protein/HPt (histidine-containing phosphotransfer) domain-containing protein
MNIPILQVALRNDQDLITARQRAKDIAERAGLGHQDQTRLITAVSEIARNALMYAGGGRLRLSIVQLGDEQHIQAIVSDSGKGIRNLDVILSERYNSRTGLGKGLAGSRRIVDQFDINTSDAGTTVTISKVIPGRSPISPKTVQTWLRGIEAAQLPSPVEQLQEQNQQLMQALQELQQVKNDLEIASRHKGEFLANVSHEIRTPLNALLGLNKLLSKTQLTEEQQRLVKLSRDAGQTLLALINDVLDMSKIESGMMAIHAIEFRIQALINGVMDMFSVQAEEKGLELVLEFDERVPPYVVGDDLRIRQVLVNLVSNAVKFSDEGKVTTTITLLSTDPQQCLVRFEVKDSGPGIAPAQQKKLFQSFTQVDGSVTRKHGGTGLGLSISRHLVELMNGRIGVESAVGKGSTFWFELPLLIAAERVPSSDTETAPAAEENFVSHLHNKIVLVAEDHPVNRLVATSELEEMGFVVHVAANGEEACDLVKRNNYQIVFMDCQMPVMDGYTASRKIRETGNEVPIVAMTANALEGDRERCLEAGMNDYISKPFETGDLQRVVTRWIKTASDEPLIDVEKLRKRYQQKQIPRLMSAFRDDLPISVSAISEAAKHCDMKECTRLAHALKGACSMVFALPLTQTMDKIEAACVAGRQDELTGLVERMEQLSRATHEACEEFCTVAQN